MKEKITFGELLNYYNSDNNYVVLDKMETKKAVYLPNCVYFDKEDLEKFKEKFDIDVKKLYFDEKNLFSVIEKIEEQNEEKAEEITLFASV